MDERKIDLMANDGKYYLLNYTHKELEELLHKLATGCLLTVPDYEKLMDIQIDNLSTFSGYYDDLLEKPDVETLEQTVEDLCNCTGGSLLQKRIDNIQEDIEVIEVKIVEEIRNVLNRQQEIQGDFVNKQEIVQLQRSIDSLSDVLDGFKNEIARLESQIRNRSSLGHTHNASEFKVGGITLDTAIGLKAGKDHTHDGLEYKIDEVDDNVAVLDAKLSLLKDDMINDYQRQIDAKLLTESKDIVGAINEIYRKIINGDN
jgi:hypothetical protein